MKKKIPTRFNCNGWYYLHGYKAQPKPFDASCNPLAGAFDGQWNSTVAYYTTTNKEVI